MRSVVFRENRWLVSADGAGLRSCPEFGGASTSRHGWHARCLHDLPVQGVPVVLELRLGRWRCLNERCARKTFVERLTTAFPFARKTQRVAGLVRLFGHAAGGRTSEKLLARLAMPVSDNTICGSSNVMHLNVVTALLCARSRLMMGAGAKVSITERSLSILNIGSLQTCSKPAPPKRLRIGSSNIVKLKSSAATAAVSTHRAFGRERRKPDKSLTLGYGCDFRHVM